MKRNDAIIFRKFVHIMIPAFGTAVAVSLNEFVDSILVSQLLGSEAMAIVNLCAPVMLFSACLYLLFGIGGSIVYSRLIGEKKEKEAENIFGQSLFIVFLISMIVMVLGILFQGPLAQILAGKSSLDGELGRYLLYLLIAFPIIIVVMTISSFLPAMNHPVLATMCAVVANVVNLILDYVFIMFFHQGIAGAAMATLAGYVVSGIILIVLFMKKKLTVSFSSAIQSLKASNILEIMKMGFADASIQLGFALTWGFRNNIAAGYGKDELVAFSFFMQLGSIISIFLAGICDGAVPVYSLLYGADDRQGIKLLTRKGLILLEICSLALIGVFLFCPGILIKMFGIESAVQAALCISSIRTFAIYAPIRSAIVFYRVAMNSGGKARYATTIAIVDSIAGIFIFSYLGNLIWGIRGLWYAYIMNILAMLLLIICHNAYKYYKSKKTIDPIYLFPADKEKFLLDYTIFSDVEEISQISEKAIECCKENGYADRISTFAGLLIEEMAVYTRNHCGNHQYLDILMKQEEDGIQIDFRSIGKPFNPMMENEQDTHYNIELINKLVDDIVYVYAMGLNTTTVGLKES